MLSQRVLGVVVITVLVSSLGECRFHRPGYRGFSPSEEGAEHHHSAPNYSELKVKDEELHGLHKQMKHHFHDHQVPHDVLETHHHHDHHHDVDFENHEHGSFAPEHHIDQPKVTTQVWTRDLGRTRIFAVYTNGTHTFSQIKKSTKAEVEASSSISGSLNSTINVVTSAEGSFEANVTSSKKHGHGNGYTTRVPGDVSASSKSSTVLTKDGVVFSSESTKSVAKMVPSTMAQLGEITVTSDATTISETLFMPFGSFVTYFTSSLTTNASWNGASGGGSGRVVGDVSSKLIFVKNNMSLSHLTVHAYGRVNNKFGEATLYQGFKVKAKLYVWSKVAKMTDEEIVIDTFTKAQSKSYGSTRVVPSSGLKGIFSSSGGVEWKKTQITIPRSGGAIHEHGHMTHMIHKEAVTHSMNNMHFHSHY